MSDLVLAPMFPSLGPMLKSRDAQESHCVPLGPGPGWLGLAREAREAGASLGWCKWRPMGGFKASSFQEGCRMPRGPPRGDLEPFLKGLGSENARISLCEAQGWDFESQGGPLRALGH